MISSKEREDFWIIVCLYFILMFCIYVLIQIQSQNQNWNNSLDCICHWEIPIYPSCLLLFYSAERTCPECHMIENTMGFRDNSFFATCPVFHHPNLLDSLPWGLQWILHRWGIAVSIYTFPLLYLGMACLPSCGG